MTLKQLLDIHGRMSWQEQDSSSVATGLCFDTRKMVSGGVYVAIQGHTRDGHDYLQEAIDQGATAVVVEVAAKVPQSYKGAVLEVLDTRLSLQVLSQKFYDQPGDQMTAIAVTGTNGKTSSAYILEFLLTLVGRRCGVIGTIDHHIAQTKWQTELTTPDPVTLQERLRDFLNQQGDSFVIEASSHALEQNRIHQGFDICLFTNLSRDHLDYHKDMDSYFQSKAKLFDDSMLKEGKEGFAVINGDDVYGLRLAKQGSQRTTFLFGQGKENDLQFKITKKSLSGCTFELQLPGEEILTFKTSLLGEHNVYNFVGGVVCLYALGYDLRPLCSKLHEFSGIPGRVQTLASANEIYGIVDFAHTPEALEKVIESIKGNMSEGELITVFGCGGDRDKGKRPMMGEVASRLSDKVIVTSDNPRTEDPQAIIDEIVEGLNVDQKKLFVFSDRAGAIKQAVALAKPKDVVLVAGKGHENYQILGHNKVEFSDYQHLLASLKDES